MSFLDRNGDLHELPEGRQMHKRVGVYGFCVRDGEILLIKTSTDDLWEIPGGGVEDGENNDEALVREFLEETGYPIVQYDREPYTTFVKDVYDTEHDDYRRQSFLYYIVREIGEQDMSSVIQSGEDIGNIITHIEWVKFSRITGEGFHDVHWPVIQEYIADTF